MKGHIKRAGDNVVQPQGRASAATCSCGSPTREIAPNLFRCTTCGRMKWGDESVSGGMIVLIIVVVILMIIILGYVGQEGDKFR